VKEGSRPARAFFFAALKAGAEPVPADDFLAVIS
jgi:hypothetical protein